ncbi:M48 family metallopeptidase [Paraferrimonas sp. SM1919]|uniref:M48 family metallopeptidase n=1 Tax=Paraferrimonas sp. SM1919 TaxID=2662263 RepID=UPI0013D5A553|nr:M48 family metallopeptidase [Paraferrimonas sp. SM1919]
MRLLIILLSVFLSSCANTTSPTGRGQYLHFSEVEMAQMGAKAFEQIKADQKVSKNRSVNRYVQCISDAITAEVSGSWQTLVFESEQINAFALPGGYIGVYTGLVELAANQHQLAAVIGHEVGHVLANHGNEKMSRAQLTQTGLSIANAAMQSGNVQNRDAYMSALGLGAQVGIILPYGREQETESDVIGAELMASAGFDPAQAPKLWQRMAAAAGSGGPELLSTHPSPQSRIKQLTIQAKKLQPIYENALKLGKQPICIKP